MADNTTVHIGENSPEEVAYKLLAGIAFVEGKTVRGGVSGEKATREYILTTYDACLHVVKGYGVKK
jgi:hypothetical protein